MHMMPSGAHLGAIGKVAKLGFPEDERVRILQRIAQLKAQYAKLGE